MQTLTKPTRKRGPQPGPPTQQYTVMLEAEPAEWAKGMTGGLSQFIRKLLRDAYDSGHNASVGNDLPR